ncbi:MAG TPA: (2Fe-2S)-binding protein [Planctomicrobium sp.]|nr:(2Fe-2S)-binding protein [Planctomicrobium sp.]
MKPDELLCYCFHVSKRKVLNYLRVHRPRRASQLSECGGAGTGCGWCVPYLKKCFRQHVEGIDSAEPELTADEYAAGRAEHIRSGKGKPRPGSEPSAPE